MTAWVTQVIAHIFAYMPPIFVARHDKIYTILLLLIYGYIKQKKFGQQYSVVGILYHPHIMSPGI